MRSEQDNLFIEFQSGDSGAFACLFNRYYNELIRFAAGLINHDQEAEDIVMDILNKLFRMREEFNSENNIKAFLYVATRNACFNYLRHQQVIVAYKRMHQCLLQDDNDMDMEAYQTEQLVMIYRAIEELPRRRRVVFKMAYLEGMPNAEIASYLGITIKAVYSHLRNARELIKMSLIK